MIKKFSDFLNESMRSERDFHYTERYAVDKDEYGFRELYLYFDDRYDYVDSRQSSRRQNLELNFVNLLTKEDDGFDGVQLHVSQTLYDIILLMVNSEMELIIPNHEIDSRSVLKKLNQIANYEETTLDTPDGELEVVKFTPLNSDEVTIDFFVEFVDFVLNNTNDPIIKKDFDESWEDYHKNIDARRKELKQIRRRNLKHQGDGTLGDF